MKQANWVVLYAVAIPILGVVAFSQAASSAGQDRTVNSGVAVTVFDATRARIRGARITVLKKPAMMAYSVTDESGQCQFDLSPDTYEILAQMAGFKEERQIVNVREHEITRIKLILEVASTTSYDPIDGVRVAVQRQLQS